MVTAEVLCVGMYCKASAQSNENNVGWSELETVCTYPSIQSVRTVSRDALARNVCTHSRRDCRHTAPEFVQTKALNLLNIVARCRNVGI